MKSYEITYLIPPSLTAQEAVDYHAKIKKTVEKNNGVLGNEQIPSKKKLAYPIGKETEGYLTSIDFEIDKKNLKDLEKEVEKESNVMRHILIEKQATKKEEEQKPARKRRSLKPEKASLRDIDAKIDEIL